MSVPPDRLLTVDEAVALILDRAEPLPARRMSLAQTRGQILAEPVVADHDSPPFAKSLMDGFAVRSSDLGAAGEHRLRVVGEVLAGQTFERTIEPGEAAQIMTGAPLPPGADAVVPVERSRVDPIDPAVIHLATAGPIPEGQFVLPRGREMREGDVLLEAGTTLRGSMMGLLAMSGLVGVRVIPLPSVALVSTGDELIGHIKRPGPGQIRETNARTLAGLIRDWGPTWIQWNDIVGDDPDKLAEVFSRESNDLHVLIVTGGVSMGTRDLVPETLLKLGVEPVFHKVAVKPGKPIWFGVGPRKMHNYPGTLVFALPGNPASCVVGFLLFVRPALDALAGRGKRPTPLEPGRLGADFRHRGDRPTYHPARWVDGVVTPLPWAGSADLRTVALADGFAAFPAGDRDHQAGEPVGFLRL